MDPKVIVIDNGSMTCKAGFSGNSLPDFIVPSIVGKLRFPGMHCVKDTYIGTEAQEKRGILSVKYPIEYGIITNWDDMRKLWSFILRQELEVDCEEHPVVLTEAPMTPRANREKMVQIWFEEFCSPAVYVGMQPVLALGSTGRLTGLSCDSGSATTSIVPVYEGHALPYAVPKCELSGADVTDFLMKLLNETSGNQFTTTADRQIVHDMKEKLCYVALNYETEVETMYANLDLKQSYELPDGKSIVIGKERFEAPELFFKPSLIGYEMSSLPETMYRAISRCNVDLRRDLLHNINISGGNSMLPGFASRVRKELELLVKPDIRVEVCAEANRIYASWVGGAILANLSSFGEMAILKEEYDEYGPNMVSMKCF